MSVFANYLRRIRSQSFRQTAAFLLHPRKVAFHLFRLVFSRNNQIQNFYPKSVRETDIRFCADVLQCDRNIVEEAFRELESAPFVRQLSARYVDKRGRQLHLGRFKCLFALVRLRKPAVVIETGVHDGLSSAMILYALEKNEHGRLISIDLPSVDMPGSEGPGWLVPDQLRQQWRLMLGDAKELLPKAQREVGTVDIFIHDSDHREPHQRFELTITRPYLSGDGLLLCDDPHVEMIMALAEAWGARVCVNASEVDNEATRQAKNPTGVPLWARTDGSAKMHQAAIVFGRT